MKQRQALTCGSESKNGTVNVNTGKRAKQRNNHERTIHTRRKQCHAVCIAILLHAKYCFGIFTCPLPDSKLAQAHLVDSIANTKRGIQRSTIQPRRLAKAIRPRKLQTNRTMNRESHTPRTDALMPDQGQKRTMLEHIEAMEAHARQLERELNAAMQAIRDIYANEYNSSETYTNCERILPKEEHLKP